MPQPESDILHDILRVPVARCPVRIHCETGETHDVDLFLPERAPTNGAQTVQDILESGPPFLPAALDGNAGTILLGKRSFRWLEAGTFATPDQIVREPEATARVRVIVQLDRGEILRGTARFDLPLHAGRLSDFLNGPAAFFPLEGSGGWYLIRKDCVTLVTEDTSSPREG